MVQELANDTAITFYENLTLFLTLAIEQYIP